MIEFRCSGCQTAFSISPDKQGKKAKCPKCGEIMQIPRLETAVPVSTAAVAAPPQASVKTPEPKAKPTLDPTLHRAAVMGSFQGTFERPKTGFLYLLSALGVAIVMVALPVIYFAFIALVAYAVYYHLVHHIGMLGWARGQGAIVLFVLYIAPLFIGGAGIFFMLRPLFAKRSRPMKIRSVTQESDPLLYDFVIKICQLVGAPIPKRIDIDDRLNASAGFRSGIWSMFRGNDLVLRIGVPLVAGLSTRQFAGVLAHEFGHFSQGAGMRLSYLIRSISDWFAQVVYQQDDWDDWLNDKSDGVDMARLFVRFTRGLLWVLMQIGQLSAGFLLRQMEYHADQYEIRLAGSDAFQQTTSRMRMLAAAYDLTIQMLMSVLLRAGGMVDDLTAFLKFQLHHLPDEIKQQIRDSGELERTSFFDSHPCDRDRIAAAVAADAPGVFHYDGLAVELFTDFQQLSKDVTRDRYSHLINHDLQPSDLMPYREFVEKYELDIFGKHTEENLKKTRIREVQHDFSNLVGRPGSKPKR
ncbi:M48 family metalloprotease [Blastopirellula marina]|uniref:Peptidase M48 domain-containing protein n=1 Tax=Blastopirellula marina TaxID=124 RepID=A0A2S8G7W1_9BACT|nr:M48 family metalloprotease [Blastopirellula marina]PQO40204.1 hypothetical protein C5Y98_06270 [Blastopirellula marina]PTL45571.1 hypothetical protein C5Y97_06270 [Blastopirellula marina]